VLVLVLLELLFLAAEGVLLELLFFAAGGAAGAGAGALLFLAGFLAAVVDVLLELLELLFFAAGFESPLAGFALPLLLEAGIPKSVTFMLRILKYLI